MDDITVYGLSHPSITLVKGLDGKTSSFKTGLDVKVKATLKESLEIQVGEEYGQVLKDCADKTMEKLGHEIGVDISVEEDTPGFPGIGEAVSCATVYAVAGLIAKKYGAIHELMMDKRVKRKFFTVDKKVVSQHTLIECSRLKGFDYSKIVSSFYGGYSVCEDQEVLRRGEMEELAGVGCLDDEYGIDDGLSVDLLHRQLVKGNMYEAMTDYALKASNNKARENLNNLNKECMAVSADEGFISGWVRGEEPPEIDVEDESIHLETSNKPSTILERPRKIYKIKKFLKLDGAGEFGRI